MALRLPEKPWLRLWASASGICPVDACPISGPSDAVVSSVLDRPAGESWLLRDMAAATEPVLGEPLANGVPSPPFGDAALQVLLRAAMPDSRALTCSLKGLAPLFRGVVGLGAAPDCDFRTMVAACEAASAAAAAAAARASWETSPIWICCGMGRLCFFGGMREGRAE